MRIVAVTSCIAGIAHTYMAAEALEQAAKKKGYEIQVETQGAAGSDPMNTASTGFSGAVAAARFTARATSSPFVTIGGMKMTNALSTFSSCSAAATARS